MGWLNSSENHAELPWVKITSLEQLREIMENTKQKPALFYKHSSRCEVCTMVLNNFRAEWGKSDGLCTLYFVDLLANRDVSNEIERVTGVQHQSPQVIVLNEDKIMYTATHSSISIDAIDLTLNNE